MEKEIIKLVEDKGYCTCQIPISKEQWLDLLHDRSIFGPVWTSVVLSFYFMPEHTASCSQCAKKYGNNTNTYNRGISALGQHIVKKLGTFSIVDESGEERFWPVAIGKGRNEKTDGVNQFVWQLRPELVEAIESDDCDRAVQVDVLGNSKAQRHNSFPGFLINSLSPVDIKLNGQPLSLPTIDGSCIYVYEYKGLVIPENVIVVGLENGENLLHLSEQMWLFEKHLPGDTPWLFVCRYTQTDSLRQWLQSIPNRYVHFGDLDLFGVRIYLTEFYNLLGDRASMLIPDDYEERIANSTATWLYTDQLDGVKNLVITDSRVRQLWECLHKYHRGYEQEGYISKD